MPIIEHGPARKPMLNDYAFVSGMHRRLFPIPVCLFFLAVVYGRFGVRSTRHFSPHRDAANANGSNGQTGDNDLPGNFIILFMINKWTMKCPHIMPNYFATVERCRAEQKVKSATERGTIVFISSGKSTNETLPRSRNGTLIGFECIENVHFQFRFGRSFSFRSSRPCPFAFGRCLDFDSIFVPLLCVCLGSEAQKVVACRTVRVEIEWN